MKKGTRKVQGVPQSQAAALLLRHQETKPNKHKSNKRTKTTDAQTKKNCYTGTVSRKKIY